MVKCVIVTFSSVALLIVLSAGQSASQAQVVDLTNTLPDLAKWKIVASEFGGPVGTSPMPSSYVPVAVHLTNCRLRNGEFYFSVEIENNRKLEAQVPISMNSKFFDHKGTIRFRELLIRLGTASNAQDATTFKNDPRFAEITLFGDRSVPPTIAVLAPGESLVLRLKLEPQLPDQNLSNLRVRIDASDETLSPSGDGFRKLGTLIPSLSAISEPNCSESKE